MSSRTHVVIVGTGETADMAYGYFTDDSPNEVVGFSAESAFLSTDVMNGLPVVPFEELKAHYDPREVVAFIAVSSVQLNRVRTRLFQAVKAAGFDCATYVSSHAFVGREATLGENCLVCQHSSIEHRARVGDNVVLRPGVILGERVVVGDHCWFSAHAVVAGNCEIGESSFLGVNSCVGDERKVARDCIVGAGAVVVRDTEPRNVYVGSPARPTGKDSFVAFGVSDAGAD